MDTFTLASIGFGGVVTACYVVFSYIRNKAATNSSAMMLGGFTLFLSGAALITGVKVMFFTFNNNFVTLAKTEGIDIPSIFFGGLALCWVSVLTIWQVFKGNP
jgi:hypothetical protein